MRKPRGQRLGGATRALLPVALGCGATGARSSVFPRRRRFAFSPPTKSTPTPETTQAPTAKEITNAAVPRAAVGFNEEPLDVPSDESAEIREALLRVAVPNPTATIFNLSSPR